MHIYDDTLKILLKRSLEDFPNRHNIVDYLIKNLSSQDMTHYIRLIVADEKIRLFRKNDIVKFIPSNYKMDDNKYGSKDKLMDFKLYRGEYMYGIITDSDDYGEKFNPHYYKMKVNIAGLDKHNKFDEIYDTLDTTSIKLVEHEPELGYLTRLFETKTIDEDRFKT